MKTIDTSDDLADGFEPSPLPPVAPDGGLELPPLKSQPSAAPSLCQQGPCVNYHCLRTQLAAQDPMPKRVDGRLVPLRARHHEDHHYCYPSTGIEIVLGDTPVLECNRWVPLVEGLDKRQKIRDVWAKTPAGLQYAADLEAWNSTRTQEEDAATQGVVDSQMEEIPLVVTIEGSTTAERLVVRPDLPLRLVLAFALEHCWMHNQKAGPCQPADWDLRDANMAAFSDLERTVEQAGLGPESQLSITRKPEPAPTGGEP